MHLVTHEEYFSYNEHVLKIDDCKTSSNYPLI